jgi:mRNA interferase RelE/StbE
MIYEISFKPAALRQIRKLDSSIQVKVIRAVESLGNDPRPDGCKKLKGDQNLYRISVSRDYRVIYAIQDSQLTIVVVKVGHRRDVYR